MTYSPRSPVVPAMVSGLLFGWGYAGHLTDSWVSGTWVGTTARYIPVFIPAVCVVKRVWWANGATVSASYNIDCGIYADAGRKPGALLVSSGSTAQGTASEVQFVDVTDTTLAPGLYWLALACSSTSATMLRVIGSNAFDAVAQFSQSSAFPLPATATPAESTTPSIPLFGFATTASP